MQHFLQPLSDRKHFWEQQLHSVSKWGSWRKRMRGQELGLKTFIHYFLPLFVCIASMKFSICSEREVFM
jgi:hypothetical protein